jgi:hypothetical protein
MEGLQEGRVIPLEILSTPDVGAPMPISPASAMEAIHLPSGLVIWTLSAQGEILIGIARYDGFFYYFRGR